MITEREVTSWAEACEQAAALIQSSAAGPLTADLVVVPSAAHRRAFSQHLASRATGPQISASIEIVTWPVLIGSFQPETWQGEALTLAVLEVLADPGRSTDLAPLLHHLGTAATRPGRRYATAQRVGRLLRRYSVQTPQLVDAWRAGDDNGIDGQPLPAAQRWQPALWRAVREQLASDPAEYFRDRLSELHARRDPQLPQRIVAVALDDLDEPGHDLMNALAAHHAVDLFVVEGIAVDPGREGSAFLRHHASRRAGPSAQRQPQPAIPPDHSTSLLHQVQHELRLDLAPARRLRADDSLQIHACHGADRQVEVLRDLLCGLFSDDPSLQPRDVVVLCTDIPRYAPLIEASFCLDPGAGFHPGHRLRVQLASGSAIAVNPVLTVLAELLDLYSQRATSVDLLDFCQLPPVAHRFGFGTDEIERLRELIIDSEIRWGVDAEQRRRNGLTITQSTWLAGVQRMLISLAMASEPPVALGTVTPLDQVQGSDAHLIGQLAELVSRVRKIGRSFTDQATPQAWAAKLREAVELLASTEFEDSWQISHALGEIADFEEQTAGSKGLLDAGDIACWLDTRRKSASRRPNYGNGSLLVTDLNDLAGIRSKVVCVLGLDDDHFPGTPAIDGDDLLRLPGRRPATHWTTDRRAVRRQRLLDALLSAEDRFVVITQGADQASGALRPVSVCIAELMEACAVEGAAGQWRAASRDQLPPEETLVRWHPLQPHGWQDYALSGADQPASFDRHGLQGARALQAPPRPLVPHWQLEHMTTRESEVDIEQLIAFFINPARVLLRQATGTTRSSFERELQTSLPIEMDYRASWSAGNDLFKMLSAGHDAKRARSSVWLSGQVLPGPIGAQVLDVQLAEASRVARSGRAVTSGRHRLADCQVELTGIQLQGRVRLFDDRIIVERFGYPRPDNALTCWLRLLLAVAALEEDAAQPYGLLIGKRCYRIAAPPPAVARQLLSDLIELRNHGLQQVLPLPLRTAAAHADLLNWKSGAPIDRARQAYLDEDANWHYFFPRFNDLLDAWPGRFEELSARVVGPINDRLERWRPSGDDLA